MSSSRLGLILLGIIYLGFVSLGLPDGTLGVAWPAIAGDLHLAIGLAGIVTTVITLLSAFSGFTSGHVAARFSTGPVVLVSCFLTGSALLAISHATNFTWLVLAAIPLGLGAGAVDASLNGFVARHYSGRHMNWLHACWGVGATCGPIVMGRAIATGSEGWRSGYLFLGATQLSLALLFILTLRLWSQTPERLSETAANATTARRPTHLASSLAGWLSPVLFALYVALEGATGLWAASILELSRGFPATLAAGCTAGYYAAITAGRILAGFGLERWGNRRVITTGVLIALVGGVLFAFAHTPILAALALALIGLGFAPIYPGLMHEVPRRFAPEAVQTVIGRQSGAAYLGMAILPATLGGLAAWSLESIPAVVAAGIILMLAGIRWLDRIT